MRREIGIFMDNKFQGMNAECALQQRTQQDARLD